MRVLVAAPPTPPWASPTERFISIMDSIFDFTSNLSSVSIDLLKNVLDFIEGIVGAVDGLASSAAAEPTTVPLTPLEPATPIDAE